MRKLGINADLFHDLDLCSALPMIKDAGFDSTFICNISDEETGKFANAAVKEGIAFETIHGPFGHINDMWLPGEGGEQMLKELMDCADICKHWGVPTMIVHISSGKKAPAVNDLGHARFDKLVEHCAKVGTNIAFENQRKLANIAFMFELYDHVPQVGFCWDCGHEQCFAGGREYMPLFGSKTMALHVHDNRCEDNTDDHLLPGDGKLNYDRFAHHLRANNYTGTLMLETMPEHNHHYDDLTHEAYFALAYERACKLRKLVDE